MKCGRADCIEDGCWIPTLVLHAKGHGGPGARFEVSTVVCEEHKTPNAQLYISDESWKIFLQWFDQRGAERPHRSLSCVEYTPFTLAIIGQPRATDLLVHHLESTCPMITSPSFEGSGDMLCGKPTSIPYMDCWICEGCAREMLGAEGEQQLDTKAREALAAIDARH